MENLLCRGASFNNANTSNLHRRKSQGTWIAAKTHTDTPKIPVLTLRQLFQRMDGNTDQYVDLVMFCNGESNQTNEFDLVSFRLFQKDLCTLAQSLPRCQEFHVTMPEWLKWAKKYLPPTDKAKLATFTHFVLTMIRQLTAHDFAHQPPFDSNSDDVGTDDHHDGAPCAPVVSPVYHTGECDLNEAEFVRGNSFTAYSQNEDLRAKILPNMTEQQIDSCRLDLQQKIRCQLCDNTLRDPLPDEESAKGSTDGSTVAHGACGHAFHQRCCEKWLLTSKECPIPMCGAAAWETVTHKPVGLMEALMAASEQFGMSWNPANEG